MSLWGIITEYLPDDETPISKSARLNIITSVLMRDDIEPYSRNELLQSFRQAGLGIRTQDFYDLYRDVRGLNISSSAIRSVPDDAIPRLETFAPNLYKQDKDFLYVVKYSFLGDDGITMNTASMALSSNFRMSKNEVLAEFESTAGEYYPNREFIFEDASVVRAFRKVT